jgi:hypothetical protein
LISLRFRHSSARSGADSPTRLVVQFIRPLTSAYALTTSGAHSGKHLHPQEFVLPSMRSLSSLFIFVVSVGTSGPPPPSYEAFMSDESVSSPPSAERFVLSEEEYMKISRASSDLPGPPRRSAANRFPDLKPLWNGVTKFAGEWKRELVAAVVLFSVALAADNQRCRAHRGENRTRWCRLVVSANDRFRRTYRRLTTIVGLS